jgi:phospholipase C
LQKSIAGPLAALLVAGQIAGTAGIADAQNQQAATPIEHLVVIFQENVSFDHYFGT